LIFKYFDELKGNNNSKYTKFENYFFNFFNFCFELSLDNVLKEIIKFKN
jgi:hypothetical protein